MTESTNTYNKNIVSAIIPSHNHGEFVSAAVESALGQIEVDVEVIVVDDGSTDNTQEVLSRFGDAIRVIHHSSALERGAARNSGVRAAKGNLLAFLDADDQWATDKLKRQLQNIMAGCGCVTGGMIVDNFGRHIGHTRPPARMELADVLYDNCEAPTSSLLVKRRAFDLVGGFPEELDVQGAEDWLFLVKLLATGERVVVIQEPLFRYRAHPEQSTATAARRSASMWASVQWMEAHRYANGRQARRLRCRRAGVIGAGFAFEGRYNEAFHWLKVATAQRMAREALRAYLRMIRAAGMGWIRRRFGNDVVDRYRMAMLRAADTLLRPCR